MQTSSVCPRHSRSSVRYVVTISDSALFLESTAKAISIDKLWVIDTELDAVVPEREQ